MLPAASVRVDVQGEGEVGLGKSLEQPVVEHRLRAGAAFFGGLADEHRPCPASGPCSAAR